MQDNSIHIEIDISDLEHFVNNVDKIPNDPKVRRDIGLILSEALLRSTDWAFKNESDPNTGEKWQNWSPSYVLSLLKQGRKPHSMLQRHGMQGGGLRSTIQENPGDGEASIRAGLGSNLRYARIHQLGGKAGRGRKVTIPARPYLGLTQRHKEQAKTKIGKLLKQAIQKLTK